MMRVTGVALAMALLSTSAHALTVAGWTVDDKPDEKGVCSVQYNYTDKDDGDAKNSVNLLFGKSDGSDIMVIALGYAKWKFDKDEKVKADLLIDDTVEQRAADWQGDGVSLVGVFMKPEGLVQSISQGKELVLRFDGDKSDEASFVIANVGQAIGAAAVCRNQIK